MADQENRRRLAAILAADVAGYTRLVEQDTDGTVLAWKAARDDVIKPSVEEKSGNIIKFTGDGFLVEFPSVQDAVACGILLQERLATNPLKFRMGINVGDITDDGGDVHGEGVNLAARLESIAAPGGICVSGSVYDQVRNRIRADFHDLGDHEVKNVSQPVRVYSIDTGAGIPEKSTGSSLTGIQRWNSKAYIAAIATSVICLVALVWWQLPSTIEYADHSPQAALTIPDEPSVVVLPLKNLSGDANQDNLSVAISADLTTELSRFSQLFVISPDSASPYGDQTKTPKQIGRALGVRFVLTGGIQRSADRLRVTMQLIEAETEAQVWTEKYDRVVTDIFIVQDEIVHAVVTELGETIWRSAADKLASKPIKDFAAYDHYLKGLDVLHKLTSQAMKDSRLLFQKSIELDPDLGNTYVGIAWTYFLDYRAQWVETGPEVLDTAEEFLQLAVDRQASGYEVHRLMAKISQARGAFDKAIIHSERALELNPNDGDLSATYAQMLTSAGRSEEALTWIEGAIRRNPHYPGWYASALSVIQYLRGDYEGAVSTLTKVNEMAVWDFRFIAASYAQLGRLDEAKIYVDKVLSDDPGFSLDKFRNSVQFRLESDKEHFLEGLVKAGFPL